MEFYRKLEISGAKRLKVAELSAVSERCFSFRVSFRWETFETVTVAGTGIKSHTKTQHVVIVSISVTSGEL